MVFWIVTQRSWQPGKYFLMTSNPLLGTSSTRSKIHGLTSHRRAPKAPSLKHTGAIGMYIRQQSEDMIRAPKEVTTAGPPYDDMSCCR